MGWGWGWGVLSGVDYRADLTRESRFGTHFTIAIRLETRPDQGPEIRRADILACRRWKRVSGKNTIQEYEKMMIIIIIIKTLRLFKCSALPRTLTCCRWRAGLQKAYRPTAAPGSQQQVATDDWNGPRLAPVRIRKPLVGRRACTSRKRNARE